MRGPTAQRLEKIASIPEEEFRTSHIAERKEKGEEITQAGLLLKARKAGGAHVSHNSGENEWYTPPEIIEGARQVMGSIDLDPASSDIAQKAVRAANYYTKENDGLAQENWYGNVWLNPPHAKELIGPFIDKLVSSVSPKEATLFDVRQAMVLVNNATETSWGQKLLSEATVVCFLSKERVKFLDPEGNPRAASSRTNARWD